MPWEKEVKVGGSIEVVIVAEVGGDVRDLNPESITVELNTGSFFVFL